MFPVSLRRLRIGRIVEHSLASFEFCLDQGSFCFCAQNMGFTQTHFVVLLSGMLCTFFWRLVEAGVPFAISEPHCRLINCVTEGRQKRPGKPTNDANSSKKCVTCVLKKVRSKDSQNKTRNSSIDELVFEKRYMFTFGWSRMPRRSSMPSSALPMRIWQPTMPTCMSGMIATGSCRRMSRPNGMPCIGFR